MAYIQPTSQLWDALQDSNIEQAARAVDAGADIEAELEYHGEHRKPLGYAAWHGHVEIAALLLDRGAQVDGADPLGETALHRASAKGYLDVAELLVSRGASLDVADKAGFTPLLWAFCAGKHEMATWLLDQGARMDVVTKHNETVLYLAVGSGYPDFARLLQDANMAAMVHAKDKWDGMTALHKAVWHGYLDHLRLLLDAGATVHVTDGKGRAPLHLACDKGRVEVVRELLQRGARVDAVDKGGWTPLMFSSDAQTARLLLEFGADRSLQNVRGATARDVAVAHLKDEVVQVLDTYFPVKLQLEQVLLGLRGPRASALTRFAQHSAFESKVLSIVAAFLSGKGSPAFAQLQREA